MNVAEDQKVNFIYDAPHVPEIAKALRPLVYKEGGTFHCVLGPDTKTGVYGTGNTAEEAVIKWADELDKGATICELDKETGHYIREKLSAINKDKKADFTDPD